MSSTREKKGHLLYLLLLQGKPSWPMIRFNYLKLWISAGVFKPLFVFSLHQHPRHCQALGPVFNREEARLPRRHPTPPWVRFHKRRFLTSLRSSNLNT